MAVVWKGPTARLSPTSPAMPAALGSSAPGHEAACAWLGLGLGLGLGFGFGFGSGLGLG